jgi:hypothetical protein
MPRNNKKNHWDKRMMTKHIESLRKQKSHMIMTKVDVEEIMDLTGEVFNDTVIKLKVEDAIILYLSIPAAIKLQTDLKKILLL